MIFADPRFFAILAGCWLTFHAVPARWRTTALAGWGVVFYAIYAWQALPLVLLLAGAALVAGGGPGTWALVGAIALVLGAFKADAGLARWLVLDAPPRGSALVLPLGLSFLAFELIHFVIERRRGRIGSVSLAELAAFAFFFPCRVAGPIRRYPAFAAAVAEARASADHVCAGLVRILVGFLKKFLVADVLALVMTETHYAATRWQAWKIVLAFGLQLYVDFSALSDIAIGASRVLGIKVPENFRSPYLSSSIREFWTRWHITLSEWVRDYAFTPVGRWLFHTPLRAWPALIATLSYLAAFLLVGAWHGLAANFLVWGLYHGLLLSGHHLYTTRLPVAVARSRFYRSRLASALATVVTFLLVSIGWVPFMLDLPRASEFLRLMLLGV